MSVAAAEAAPTTVAARVDYLLQLADTSLILGQRLGEWVGHAPAIEEDLGLANTALDLIGQARLLLSYAGEVEGRGRSEDQLAFLRDQHEYRNPLLVEQPNGDFGHTMSGCSTRAMRGSPRLRPRRSRRPVTISVTAAAGWSGSATARQRATRACSRHSGGCGR
jgi:hypothetical protein